MPTPPLHFLGVYLNQPDRPSNSDRAVLRLATPSGLIREVELNRTQLLALIRQGVQVLDALGVGQ